MVELGTDLNDLSRPRGQESMTFEYDGKAYKVTYKAVSWESRMNAIEQGWKERTFVEGGETKTDIDFDTAQYYTDMFLEAILDINGQAVSKQLLATFDHDVITKLLPIVPSPLLIPAVLESKKES